MRNTVTQAILHNIHRLIIIYWCWCYRDKKNDVKNENNMHKHNKLASVGNFWLTLAHIQQIVLKQNEWTKNENNF